MKVYILLSTYQGEKFLAEQLDSLIQQEFKNWELWIRDDGSQSKNSQDQTLRIIEKYIQQDPRINLLKDDWGNQGPAQSFGILLAYLQEQNPGYVMLCDQDDIWLPQKISQALIYMQTQEKLWGETTPILVHTDLVVVDKNLNEISSSFFAYQNQNPAINAPHRLLMQNTVTGCTSLLNQALLQKLGQKIGQKLGQKIDERNLNKYSSLIPKEALMHDMWIALVASFFGKICPMADPSEVQILYRQHGLNDTGAKKWGLGRVKNLLKILKNLERKTQQARGFLACYQKDLNPSQQELLKIFGELFSRNFLMRRWVICRHGFYLQGFLRNLALFLLI